MKKCKNEKKLRSYDKERDIEVYRADDSIDRYGDCNGTGSYKLRCSNVKIEKCKNVIYQKEIISARIGGDDFFPIFRRFFPIH